MLKVAIAEDDFRVASIHEQFLRKMAGIECAGTALNANEVKSLLKTTYVDILLLDNYMPDQFGASLLPELRRDFPETDIIMITASTEKNVVEAAVKNGVIDYIVKPVTFERFQTALQKVTNRRKLIATSNELNQAVIDQIFGKGEKPLSPHELPKGIDPLTLKKVQETMQSLGEGINAEVLSDHLGASRTTARRYLEYLISIGQAKAELEYGIVGRPERKYYLV